MGVLATELRSLGHCLRDSLLFCLPNDWLSQRFLRPWVLRLMGVQIGRGSNISRVRIIGYCRNIQIGRNAFVNSQTFFHAGGKIILGDNVTVGFGVTFITGNHEIGEAGQRCGRLIREAISIESGVWIAAGAFIGPGVTVGEGSVVAAGAVVMRSMPANSLIGGVPAKVIRKLA